MSHCRKCFVYPARVEAICFAAGRHPGNHDQLLAACEVFVGCQTSGGEKFEFLEFTHLNVPWTLVVVFEPFPLLSFANIANEPTHPCRGLLPPRKLLGDSTTTLTRSKTDASSSLLISGLISSEHGLLWFCTRSPFWLLTALLSDWKLLGCATGIARYDQCIGPRFTAQAAVIGDLGPACPSRYKLRVTTFAERVFELRPETNL